MSLLNIEQWEDKCQRAFFCMCLSIGVLLPWSNLANGNGGKPMDLSLQLRLDKDTYKRDESIRLTWSITNNSSNEIMALSHYAATEQQHFDNMELEIVRLDNYKVWKLPLFSVRKAVTKVACLMDSGDILKHEINLNSWLNLHQIDVGIGAFQVVAIYRVVHNELAIGDWMSCHDVKSFNYGEQRFVHGEPRLPWLGLLRSNGVVIQISE